MLRVRCIRGCRPPGFAPLWLIPISRVTASLSSEALSAVGGKSTIRKTEPRAGGATPISRSARSDRPEIWAGVSSVTHSSVDTIPPLACLNLTFVAGPSMPTMALPAASCVVTTRLISCNIRSFLCGVSGNFLFRLDAGFLEYSSEFGVLAPEQFIERLGRPADDVEAAFDEALAHVGLLEDSGEFAVQPQHDVVGRPARHH